MSPNTSHSLSRFLEAFFLQRLLNQRQASSNTVKGYRDTFRLLLRFAHSHLRREPAAMKLADLNAPLIGAFLDHLERTRGNGAGTRNIRLAAIRSFFKFVAIEEPSAGRISQQVLAIPTKRTRKPLIHFLDGREVDALISAPDPKTWAGLRDRALLLLAIQTGLRVSELTGLEVQDTVLGRTAYVHCRGKGRKDRCTPLRREVVRAVRDWLRVHRGQPSGPLFPNARGLRITRDGVAYLLTKHVAAAVKSCPSLRRKRVTPHVLRHTAAMTLLQAGVDRSVIALWLGHESAESTEVYLHADLKIKERALARTAPQRVRQGRYRPSDALLKFLEGL
ncbi:MAG: tyrosine-type recombinase/integrase [Planctomycetota bacterium]